MITNTCVEKLKCVDCGSMDNRQVYLNVDTDLGVEWFTSFCHGACWEQKGDPYTGDKPAPKVVPKTEEEKREEMLTVLNCPLFKPTKGFRKITAETYQHFRVRLLFSEYDGITPYAVAFPFSLGSSLSGYKCRPLFTPRGAKKKFFAHGEVKTADLFGMWLAIRNNFSNDILFATEGEYDTLAAYQMTSGEYPFVSIKSGAGSAARDLAPIMDYWKRVIIILDDDPAGRESAEKTRELLPKLEYIWLKEYKDPNDYLMNDASAEFVRIIKDII